MPPQQSSEVSEFAKVKHGRRTVGSMRLFFGVEDSEAYKAVIDFDLCAPWLPGLGITRNPFIATGVYLRKSRVSYVHSNERNPQIYLSIIQPVPVDMVYNHSLRDDPHNFSMQCVTFSIGALRVFFAHYIIAISSLAGMPREISKFIKVFWVNFSFASARKWDKTVILVEGCHGRVLSRLGFAGAYDSCTPNYILEGC